MCCNTNKRLSAAGIREQEIDELTQNPWNISFKMLAAKTNEHIVTTLLLLIVAAVKKELDGHK